MNLHPHVESPGGARGGTFAGSVASAGCLCRTEHSRGPIQRAHRAIGERDPAKVLQDVRRGLVSAERARLDYGVALDRAGTAVDAHETEKLRAATAERGRLAGGA